MTARTEEEVRASMVETYEDVDPSTDVHKGPVLDLSIQPVAPEISAIEVRQDHTDALASAQFDEAADDEELETMASTVGAGNPQGETSKGTVFLGTRSRPIAGSLIPIPIGTLVAIADRSLVYRTTIATFINGDYADAYYNSAKRTYEVEVPIEGIAVGSDYDVPAYRIILLLTPIQGIDFAENRSTTSGGIGPGDRETLINRAENKLVGQELGTPGGLVAAILEDFEDANTVAIITSGDYTLFRRAISGPGADYYYSGTRLVTETYEFTAVGGETQLFFPNAPMRAVSSFYVNGIPTAYTVVADVDDATVGSSLDQTKMQFAALPAAATVRVTYSYDSLASLIDAKYAEDSGFFETSILARRSVRGYPRLRVEASANTGFNVFSLRTSMVEATQDFFETGTHGADYLPTAYRDYLRDTVVGISNPVVTLFYLEGSGLLDVEPIELDANMVAEVDLDLADFDLT